MNMNIEEVTKIITIYLSASEETKQEIKNVLIYLDSLMKPKS